jgi:hypothetical protein
MVLTAPKRYSQKSGLYSSEKPWRTWRVKHEVSESGEPHAAAESHEETLVLGYCLKVFYYGKS